MSVVRGQVIFRVYSNNETFENWNLIEDIVLCLRFLIWCRRWRTIKVRCSLCRCRVSPLSWHSSNMKSHIITRMSIIRCSGKARLLHATVSIAIFILNKASAHDPPYSPAGRWSLYIYIYIYILVLANFRWNSVQFYLTELLSYWNLNILTGSHQLLNTTFIFIFNTLYLFFNKNRLPFNKQFYFLE